MATYFHTTHGIHKFGDANGYESSESNDIDFYVDYDNILDEVEVDMNDFNDNIDMDAE